MKFSNNRYQISPTFPGIMDNIVDRTMVDREKLKLHYEYAIRAKFMEGAIAEAGVWRGGIVYLYASVILDKAIYAFDSWEGLPEPSLEDMIGLDKQEMPRGWGACDMPNELLGKFGNRIILHKGWFKDTLHRVAYEKFCLVHIDCDQYQSVQDCLNFFYPRMIPGGFILIDDYGFRLTPGATLAVDEFFDKIDIFKYNTFGGLYIELAK